MASTQTRWQIAGDYKKPSAKAPVIDPGDEAPFLVRGGEEERAACLTETVQPAIIGIDVLLPAPGEAHEHKATQREQAAQPENPHVFAGTASGCECRAGQTHPGASGSRAAVLQRGALRRAAAATPHASRSSLARGPRHPPDTQSGAAGRLFPRSGAPPPFPEQL